MSDILDLLGISLEESTEAKQPKPSKPRADMKPTGGNIEDAARALAEAVGADTGRRKSLGHWKKVVARALGISKLFQKRYDAVLSKGVSMGLFEVDRDSGSYPFIVRLEPVPDEPEVAPEPEGPVVIYRSTDRVTKPEPEPELPSTPPEDWDPPSFLICGHWAHQKIKKTEEECTPAEKERLDDYRAIQPYKMVRVYSPEECHYCQTGRSADSYQHQKGEYRQPVPVGLRRSAERDRGHGWPGLCCDEDGYYIGGIANLCTYQNRDGPHCAVHKRPESPVRGKRDED